MAAATAASRDSLPLSPKDGMNSFLSVWRAVSRDIPSDSQTGKITLAVRLGDARSRLLFTVLLTLPVLYTILIAFGSWAALVALVYIPFALKSVRTVNRGAKGKELIPVLGLTGRAMLIWAVLSALAVAVV